MLVDHHAVLYIADSLEHLEIPDEMKRTTVDTEVFSMSTLSIATVRTIIDIAYQKPVEEKVRTIVIVSQSIAIEAQHALLKILEDPPPTTRFILTLSSSQQLLPTLISRLHVVSQSEIKNQTNDDYVSFLSLSYKERMELITKKAKEKDSDWMARLLSAITKSTQHAKTLKEKKLLMTVSEFQHLRGASKKMLIEALALSLPVEKP